jgi:hypothetical protein
MRLLVTIARLFMLGSLLAISAGAQVLVESKGLPQAISILDKAPSTNQLPCTIQLSNNLRLDLLFRYTAGFAINCRLGELLRPGMRLVALVRVTPEFKRPTILFEYFELPQVQQQASSSFYAPLSKVEVSMSGGFAVGPGKYSVEVVLTDLQGRTSRTQRKLRPALVIGSGNVPAAYQPGAVASLVDVRWNGSFAAQGPRLTVLLNTSGLSGTARLHTWKRTVLLQSLVTLLNQLPYKSVKLIAFDSDRLEEVFSQESFDIEGFDKLEKALEQMAFNTIPYQSLKKDAWSRYLVDLAQRESLSKKSPDEIVFLGTGGSHAFERLPENMPREIGNSKARFFYFELFPDVGWLPDGVEQLTRDMHGLVFPIRSPETLEQAIKKTMAQTTAPSDQ